MSEEPSSEWGMFDRSFSWRFAVGASLWAAIIVSLGDLSLTVFLAGALIALLVFVSPIAFAVEHLLIRPWISLSADLGPEPPDPKMLPDADTQLQQISGRLGRRLLWEDSIRKARQDQATKHWEERVREEE